MVWNPRVSIYISVVFTLTPIIEAGYLMFSLSKNVQEAVLALKITYLGGCFSQLMILLSALFICKTGFKNWMEAVLIAFGLILYGGVLTIGYSDIFYRSVSYELTADGVVMLNKEYGPLHTVFYAMLLIYMLLIVIVLIYTELKKRKDVPTKTIMVYIVMEVLAMGSFFLGRMASKKIELMAADYVVTMISFLVIMIYDRLYHVAHLAADEHLASCGHGFVTFDKNRNFIEANKAACDAFPELNDLKVDKPMSQKQTPFLMVIAEWFELLDRTGNEQNYAYEQEDRVYDVTVARLKHGRRSIGYTVAISDRDPQNV
ncbi:MAG: hypothetical protein K6G81_11685 [Lachnospiraceae bacterium]|nr:hypothetical protein [Lachnospiraceae bacterium]